MILTKRCLLLSVGLLFSVEVASALIPERRRLYEEREENVYMIIPAIASLPGAGVFFGVLGSFSNIGGTGIDAAVTKAETISDESDIHINAFALREIPLFIPGLTFEYWFGDMKLNEYNSYLPGRNSPDFTIPYTAEFDYHFVRPAYRLWERRIGLFYNLIFFKGFAINQDGHDVETATHSASGMLLVDLTDDEIDPRVGLRYQYRFSMAAPTKTLLGEDSESGDGERLSSRNHSLSIYIPVTDRWMLALNKQQFSADGREDTDEVVSGGSLSLRGYPGGRWSDRYGESSAIEGRYTIPIDTDLNLILVRGRLDGVQLAGFYETGQVSPKADDRLYSDLHQSFGFGVRALLDAIVLRLDLAFSDEGHQTHLTIDQPF
jgi:hypothetical protein